jgi:hypothetical protein
LRAPARFLKSKGIVSAISALVAPTWLVRPLLRTDERLRETLAEIDALQP